MALADLVGPPVAALCPPGACVFTPEWSPAKLLERQQVTHDTILLTFGLADESKPLGLSTCACILTKIMEEGSPDPIVRPYTPVSTNAMSGKFQLCVKVYEGGKVSGYMNNMEIGSTMDFKHIEKNVKIQYPFNKKYLTMLVGGTGITPMIQALHAILGTAGDQTQVSLVFGNKEQKDILCKDLLDKWGEDFKARFQVTHILSNVGDDASWTGAKGFIDKACIEQTSAPPGEDVMVMVCGPPPMYEALCGPRDKPELTGLLADMGYKAEQVFKF